MLFLVDPEFLRPIAWLLAFVVAPFTGQSFRTQVIGQSFDAMLSRTAITITNTLGVTTDWF